MSTESSGRDHPETPRKSRWAAKLSNNRVQFVLGAVVLPVLIPLAFNGGHRVAGAVQEAGPPLTADVVEAHSDLPSSYWALETLPSSEKLAEWPHLHAKDVSAFADSVHGIRFDTSDSADRDDQPVTHVILTLTGRRDARITNVCAEIIGERPAVSAGLLMGPAGSVNPVDRVLLDLTAHVSCITAPDAGGDPGEPYLQTKRVNLSKGTVEQFRLDVLGSDRELQFQLVVSSVVGGKPAPKVIVRSTDTGAPLRNPGLLHVDQYRLVCIDDEVMPRCSTNP